MSAVPPRVRPPFVTGSMVTLAMLLPVFVYVTWDYVEARRLRVRLDAIVARGEPVARPFVFPQGQAADAARYYGAASVLTVDYTAGVDPSLLHDVALAERSGQWPPQLVQGLREIVAAHAEALGFLDRAAPLPFEGFRDPNPPYRYAGGLIGAEHLNEFRTRVRVLEGDRAGATQSMYAGIRLMRTIPRGSWRLAALTVLLERTPPSAAARTMLSDALAEFDRDDGLRRQLLEQRMFVIDRLQLTRDASLVRPWTTHALSRDLDTFEALIDAAGRPASERAAAVVAVGRLPGAGVPPAQAREVIGSITRALEQHVGRVRCARRLLAGEVVDCHF